MDKSEEACLEKTCPKKSQRLVRESKPTPHVCIHRCAFNLFAARPSTADCFVSNPVLSKLTWWFPQEVHRSLPEICRRTWSRGLLCSWMPGSRVVSCLLVMRGNVGGIMGRWRCLRCCPHHTANLPRTAAELAAAAETLAFPPRCRGAPWIPVPKGGDNKRFN